MIGIFKTNITTQEQRQQMIQAIQNNFEVGHCHVDLEDCDKVLRIVDMKVDESAMVHFVQQQGFHCEVME